jgi:hypothetical protein
VPLGGVTAGVFPEVGGALAMVVLKRGGGGSSGGGGGLGGDGPSRPSPVVVAGPRGVGEGREHLQRPLGDVGQMGGAPLVPVGVADVVAEETAVTLPGRHRPGELFYSEIIEKLR